MYDIEVHDPNNFYTHFLELMANYFPMRNFQIQSRSCTLNVTFRNQPCQAPILYLFILSVNSYDNYKSAGRAKLIQFMERTPPNKALVLFFPSLLRVDEKVNKILTQTYELIQADLTQLKGFPKEKVQKLVFYDPDKEMSREKCLGEFILCLKAYIAGLLEKELSQLEEQVEELYQVQDEKGFSYYKLFSVLERKAQLYTRVGLKQEALEIYSQFEGYFLYHYPLRPSIFNQIHPFDFLSKKTIEANLRNFEDSGDESQSTVLDFLTLVQHRIIDLLSILNQITCSERIIDFSQQAELVVNQQIKDMESRNQFLTEERDLWSLGLLIWQHHNMTTNLSHMSKVPQNFPFPLSSLYQKQLLKVRTKLLQITEEIGRQLYGINFASIRCMSIEEQCKALEQQILGELATPLQPSPPELLKTYLLSDTKLRGQIEELNHFVKFYNSCVHDIISVCQSLGTPRVEFEHKFMLMKLKNLYPQLEFNGEMVDHQTKFKRLHASILVQKLIMMARENMQLNFQECFNEALTSELPGHCFTKLFQILKLPLTKLKFVFFGYFESLIITDRRSKDEFEFRAQMMKYLAVECDGQLEVTLKPRGKDKPKLKIRSETVQLRDSKKPTFAINTKLTPEQGNCYTVQKAVFYSGPFKLYFDVSQKAQQQRLYLMYPQIEMQQRSCVSNIGTAFSLKLHDITDKQAELKLHTPLKLESELYGDGPQVKKVESNHFQISSEQLQLSESFTLYLFGLEEQSTPQPLKVVLQIGDNQFVHEIKLTSTKDVAFEDLSDLVEDEYELLEVQCLSRNQSFLVKNEKVYKLQYQDSLRQLVQKGQQIYIKADNEAQQWFTVQQILEMQQRAQKVLKSAKKQPLFRITVIAVFHQENTIPYKPAENFKVIIKIQYLGVEDLECKFTLMSYSVKGSRSFQDQFSKNKTILIKECICFLTGADDFEQPVLRVTQGDILLHTETEFQLQIEEQ